eukprot:gene10335-2749_t
MKEFITLLFLIYFVNCSYEKESYNEKLYIKQLLDGKISFNFEFTTETTQKKEINNFKLFPKDFTQIVQKFEVKELHLSLTQGRWNYEKWGSNPTPAPVGAELITWFKNNDTTPFKGLVHSLSGLFCASLNFFNVEDSRTYAAGTVSSDIGFKYGTLSQEAVCTENLTPFKQMLPSKGRCGFGKFLNPIKIFDADFHSMGIHYKDGKLIQTISVVLNPTEISNFDINFSSWSLNKLFQPTLENVFTCPFSKETKLFFENSNFKNDEFEITPKLNEKLNEKFITFKNFRMKEKLTLDFHWKKNIKKQYDLKSASPITVKRYQTGYGLFEGGLVTKIQNNLNQSIEIFMYDAIPWYFRIYFHKLQFQLNSKPLKKQEIKLNVQQGKIKSNPYVYQFIFNLPPLSILEWNLEFDKLFLGYLEHSPDANRGFDLSSPFVAFNLTSKKSISGFEWNSILNQNIFRYYADSLLIALPTPDFSMPYNVMTLSCTLIALFIVSLFNVIARKDDEEEDKKSKNEEKQKIE